MSIETTMLSALGVLLGIFNLDQVKIIVGPECQTVARVEGECCMDRD